MFQSTAVGPACRQFGYLPCPYWRGASEAPVFRGALQIPQQGPAAVQGLQRQRRQGLDCVGVGFIRGYWHGTTGGSGTEAVWVTNLRTSAWPLDVPQNRISWGCCRRMEWESRSALSKIRQGAWHRIFHISPWFLLIDEFNSIVFHPTIKITWRSIKNRMRGRNISCNNGFVVYLHFAD
jgi:hypothetical protein